MLDLNNIIQNTASLMDVLAINETEPSLDLHEDQNDSDAVIDPGSFVLLMSEIMSTMPAHEDSKTVVIDDTQDVELVADNDGVINNPVIADSSTPQPTVTAAESEVSPEGTQEPVSRPVIKNNQPVKTDAVIPESEPAMLDNNVALTWIDAENFEPPKPFIKIMENKEQLSLDVEHAPLAVDSTEMEALAIEVPIKMKEVSIKGVHESEVVESNAMLQIKDLTPQRMPELTATASFIVAETVYSSADTNQKIDGLLVESAQNNTQLNQIVPQDNEQFSGVAQARPLEIPIDINNPEWNHQFSEHIVWLSNQGIKSAVIKLHPEDLGPLEISVKVEKNTASINIISQNSHVRDIVDQALPRLREMMTEQGLNLAEVHVGADGNSRQFAQSNQKSAGDNGGAFVEEQVQITPLVIKQPKGLIDYFA